MKKCLYTHFVILFILPSFNTNFNCMFCQAPLCLWQDCLISHVGVDENVYNIRSFSSCSEQKSQCLLQPSVAQSVKTLSHFWVEHLLKACNLIQHFITKYYHQQQGREHFLPINFKGLLRKLNSMLACRQPEVMTIIISSLSRKCTFSDPMLGHFQLYR